MKGYVITLQSAAHALEQLDRFLKQAEQWKWDVEPYWAVEGQQLSRSDFKKAGLYLNPNTTIAQRIGAQGCFMSHWNLWHLCKEKNEPIIIFESDAYIQGPMPNFDFSKGIIKLHTDRGTKVSNITGKWSKGAHAYALTPNHASLLIDHLNRTEVKPADKAIGDNFVPWRHLETNLVPQIRLGSSTTAHKRY